MNIIEKLLTKALNAVKKDYDNAENNPSYDNYDKRRRLMGFNRFFSDYKVLSAAYISGAVIFLVILLKTLNSLQNGSITATLLGKEVEKSVSIFGTLFSFWPVVMLFIGIAVVGYFKFTYQVRVSFGSINVGQKGTARWTTREEIESQYKKIPEKIESFPGMGGLPAARDEGVTYIDTDNTNTLALGISRSGKDQILTDNFIENISRAEEKCSMIIGDPKLEAAFKSIPELRRRGYRTYIFNLIDPDFSMKYNPLTMIIDEYKTGDKATAQQLCFSLGMSIFAPNPEERDPYWQDMARMVFVACVWAEIEDNIALDKEENKRRYFVHKYEENERKKKYYKELYGNDYELYRKAALVNKILKKEPDIEDEDLVREFYLLCDLKKIELTLTEEEISKAKNFKFKRSNFTSKKYYPVNTNERKINIYSIIKMCNTLSSSPVNEKNDMLDFYFMNRPEDDFARITYGDVPTLPRQTKGTIMTKFKQGIQVFMLDNIAQMTCESEINLEEIFFSEKPVAIFYSIPDYDKAFHFLATVFVSQLYFVAAKLATAMPEGKLPRRFHFWLNELCNIPKIDNLAEMSTVCLGRNIVLHLLIQSYGQLEKIYGDDAKTLKDNSGNEIYIKASAVETLEEVSKKLGTETQTVLNRTGKKLSINKELTEMSEEVPLMTAEQLMKLELGEMILIRTMKRKDLNGNLIKSHPIKNFGEYRMKLSYEYLEDVFPQGQMLYKSPQIERIIRANEIYRNMEWNLVDGGIEKITGINIKKRSRDAGGYIKYMKWRRTRFKAGTKLEIYDLKRMNEVFKLLNLSEEQKKLYMIAGLPNKDGEIIMPEYTLLNGQIEEHAYKLIRCRDRKLQEKGYRLLDILRPLGPKEISAEEKKIMQETEEYISYAGGA